MRYLTLDEVLALHRLALEQAGGAPGLLDLGGLESAVAQPYMAFAGQDLYPTLVDKAAALAFSLVMNHPFVDGNKRVGHAAMETFLVLNSHELSASVDEQENSRRGTSALSTLNFRVQRLQFRSGVVDPELPIHTPLLLVAGCGPSCGLPAKFRD